MTNVNTFQGDVFIHEYIKHTGDENTYFGFSGTDTFKIATGGEDRFEVDSNGYVHLAKGIRLAEGDDHNILIPNYIKHTGDDNTYFGFDTNDSYVIATANNTRFRVNSSGQVHIYDGNLWIPDWVRHQGDDDCYFGFGVGTDRFDVVTSGGYRLQVLNNGVINIPVSMTFGSQVKQMIGLYGNDYALGVQSSTWYARTGQGNFAFHRSGSHVDGENNPGPGGYTTYVINRNNTVYNYGADYTAAHKGWSGQANWDINVTLQAPNAVFYHARCIGWATYSSRKLKENFEPLLDSLDKVKRLNGLYYTWKEGGGDNLPPPDDFDTRRMEAVTPQKYIGFIADEVAEVLPISAM